MTGREAAAKDSRNDEGFTLVEMLVALAITALLSSLLVVAFAQLRPLRAITQTIATEMELASVAAYLVDLLSGARPLALQGDDPDRKIVFEGTAQRLRFVTVSRTGSTRSSLRDVELFARQRGDRLELVERTTRRRLFASPQADSFVVAADLDAVRFQYLDSSSGRDAGPWLDTWTDADSLPRGLKISLRGWQSGRSISIERLVILQFAP